MANTPNLHALVEGFAARLETLQLSGDDQEEYSTVLSMLENQADHETPNLAIVFACIDFLGCYGVSRESRRPAA